MNSNIKIIVADGCQFMRAGVIERLIKPQSELVLVGEAENQQQVIELYEKFKPELLLFTLNIACAELSERIAAINRACPKLSILLLTACQDGVTVQATMRAGAKGYVLSSESTAMILSAIHQVAQGNSWVSPCLGSKLLAPPQPSLGTRALEILSLLVEGKTDQEISMILKIADRTIRYHLNKIYDALSVNSRAQAVAVGLRLNLV